MNPTRQQTRSVWSIIGRVALGLGIAGLGLIIASVVLIRLLVVNTLQPDEKLFRLQERVVHHLGASSITDVRVVAPSWLVTLARMGTCWIDLEPEARLAVETIHSGQVSVFELANTPDPGSFPKLIALVDEELSREGWDRMVTVLEDNQMILVYTFGSQHSEEELEVYVIVLADRNLVAVKARGYTEPLMELASIAMDRLNPPTPWASNGSTKGNDRFSSSVNWSHFALPSTKANQAVIVHSY